MSVTFTPENLHIQPARNNDELASRLDAYIVEKGGGEGAVANVAFSTLLLDVLMLANQGGLRIAETMILLLDCHEWLLERAVDNAPDPTSDTSH